MKEKKAALAYCGVTLLPPALLVLIVSDMIIKLPETLFGTFLAVLVISYGFCADLYIKAQDTRRQNMAVQALNAVFYLLWLVILIYKGMTDPRIWPLPLVGVLFAAALVLLGLSLKKLFMSMKK